MSERSERSGPGEGQEELDKIARDVARLRALSGEQYKRLIDVIAGFTPAAALGLAEEEIDALVARSGVAPEDALAAFRLARYAHTVRARITDLAARLAERLGASEAEVCALLEGSAAAGAKVAPAIANMQDLSRAMATYGGCHVACDLRMSPDKAGAPAAVAIVRIVLDEGDDAVFQCTRAALAQIVAKFRDAERMLESLEAMPWPWSPPEGG